MRIKFPSREYNMRSEVKELLAEIVEWTQKRDDLLAVALVGSQARGEAKTDSDIDILLLFDNPEIYLENYKWISLFGGVTSSSIENWGKVVSIRVFYFNGLEVEFGLTDGSWGADPNDAGDKQVINDGIIILHEKRRHLSIKLKKIAQASGSNSLKASG
jgi:hypothetical protein